MNNKNIHGVSSVEPEETKGAKFLRVARLADFSVMTNCMAAEIDAADIRSFKYPVWVRNCGRRVTRALFPRVYRAVAGKSPSRAYDLGLAFGLMESGQKMLVDLFSEVGPIPASESADVGMGGVWELLRRNDARELTFPADGDLIPLEIRDEVAKRLRGFDVAHHADYHQGVADVSRMMAGENAATLTTDVYLFMLIFWRAVDGLPTFEAFYDIMVKAFGQNRIGSDPKRLLQICQRVGKRFRRPGRPPKKQLQPVVRGEVIS